MAHGARGARTHGRAPPRTRNTKREARAEKREAEVQANLARLRGQAPDRDAASNGRSPPHRVAAPVVGPTDQQQRTAKMRKLAVMINALVNLKKADEDGELDWVDDKLEELRSRAKGADPPPRPHAERGTEAGRSAVQAGPRRAPPCGSAGLRRRRGR